MSISAINAAQIEVVFNQAVDKDSVQDLTNYYVGLTKDVSANSIEALNSTKYEAVLQADEKTVIISAKNLASDVIWIDENTDVDPTVTALVTSDGPVLKNRTVFIQLKDIKTRDGKLQSAMESSFVAKDSVGPKFAKDVNPVENLVDNFTITFSEPVVFNTFNTSAKPAQFYLNGTNVTGDVAYAEATPATASDFSTVEIDLATLVMELEEGINTFEVVGLQDLSGNSTTPGRITTTIKVDKKTNTAPKVVGIEQMYDSAFRVIFDKPVEDSTGTITIKNLANDNQDAIYTIKNAGTATHADAETEVDTTYVKPAGTTNTAYTVQFDDDIDTSPTVDPYKGANSIIRTIVIEDYASGTKVGTKYSKAHKFVKDNLAPTIVDAKLIKDTTNNNETEDNILLTFEDAPFYGDVIKGSAANDFVLKLVEGGITHTVTIPDTDFVIADVANAGSIIKNAFVLDLDSTDPLQKVLFNGDKLKSGVTVKVPYDAVTDNEGDLTPQYNGPFSFIGTTITVKGGSSAVVPQTSQKDVTYDDTLNIIEVKFTGEDINALTATNKANYTFDGSALPSGATIEFDSNNIARIKLPQNSVVRDGNYTLTIKNVATNSGAKMLPTTVTVYDVKDNTQPIMTSAKVTSDNTVEVTFDETLELTNSDLTQAVRNFKVVIRGVNFNVADVSPKGTSTRTLVLTTSDTFDYSKGVSVSINNDASNDMFIEDVAGNKAATGTVKAVIDIE